jgi:hypothetical protein
MLGRFSALLTAAALVLTAAVAAQQPLSSHTLIGNVTDSWGQVLPGVTVELSKPAESHSVRTVVTDRRGIYRIEKVLPGMYVLVFKLPGFGSAIRDIEIGGGPPQFEYDVQLSPSASNSFTVPGPAQPSKRVICGMTVITPPRGIDPGIQKPRKPPPAGEEVKPTIRAIQPTLCWEPSTDSPRVPPRQ